MRSPRPRASSLRQAAVRCCCPRTASGSPRAARSSSWTPRSSSSSSARARAATGPFSPPVTVAPGSRSLHSCAARSTARSPPSPSAPTAARRPRSQATSHARWTGPDMERLEVKLGKRAYPILVGPGLLGSRELLARHAAAAKLLVVTDEAVGPLWLPRLEEGLAERDYTVCVLPDGEQQKTLGNVATIIDALVEARINRDGAVRALGGGVIGDIAGFAAASYQRGIAIVQLPTTLLAQVDSSVGGKTGVNHPGGKNLIGAFHQPTAVISDIDTLSTLPDRQLRAGFTEIVKAALVADAA